MNLAGLAVALARLDLDAAAQAALDAQARGMADSVRDALSHAPGEAHLTPWRRSGALQASIGVAVDGPVAVIGSTDPVAVWQEHGTPTVPPRPFLAPAARQGGAPAAAAIGAAVIAALGDA